VKDHPVKHWLSTVTPDDLRNGRDVCGKEVSGEVSIKSVSHTRPEPVNPLGQDILKKIRANTDSTTKGITVILRRLPNAPMHSLVYYTIKSNAQQGEIAPINARELEVALTELRNLSWLRLPTNTSAVVIYPYIDEV
jgi:hypothetical protein